MGRIKKLPRPIQWAIRVGGDVEFTWTVIRRAIEMMVTPGMAFVTDAPWWGVVGAVAAVFIALELGISMWQRHRAKITESHPDELAQTHNAVTIEDASVSDTSTDGDMWRVDVRNFGADADFRFRAHSVARGEEWYFAPWRLDASRQSIHWPIATGQAETVNLARQSKRKRNWLRWIGRQLELDLFSTSIGSADDYSFPRPLPRDGMLLDLEIWHHSDGRRVAMGRLKLTHDNGGNPLVESVSFTSGSTSPPDPDTSVDPP